MPRDTKNSVAEPSLQVRQTGGVQTLLSNHLAEVVQHLVNVGITGGVAQDTPDSSLTHNMVSTLDSDQSLADAEETSKDEKSSHHPQILSRVHFKNC